MTYYAGLDISMKATSIAIVDVKGHFVFESVCDTSPEVILQTLSESGYILEKIGLEAGCLSFWLLEQFNESGVKAICIESRQMATLIALKVNKTDKNDARLIANAMRANLYKEVHHKSKEAIEIGLQMNVRRTLVDTRTKLKNSTRGFLKAYGIRLGSIAHTKFSEAIQQAIEGLEDGVKEALECLLKSFEEVCRSIEKIDANLEKLSRLDAVIAIFETIPGVGPITSLTYKATIDNPFRFKDPRDIGAYLGLTPCQYSSGDVEKQGRISKCGSTELRTLLIECATVILTRMTVWTKLRAWGLKLMRKNGLKKAAVAVARKLAIIMLRMWQTMKPFQWDLEEKSTKEQAKTEPRKMRKAQVNAV